MSKQLSILILEDDPADAELQIATLEAAGYSCHWDRVDTKEAFLAKLETLDYDLIMADFGLPVFDGLSALNLAKEVAPAIPFILISGELGEELAIECLKSGATDYVLKQRLARLGHVVERALREKSDQQQHEIRLRASEERFRQVVSSISDHIYLTEVQGDRAYINHYLSPHVERLTGYPLANFIADWSFWGTKVIHPEDQAIATKQMERLATGYDSEAEYRLVRADGNIIWVRDSARSVQDEHRIMIYGVVSDVTERKRAQQTLEQERASLAQRVAERTADLSRANAELARASRLKDEFLANMSHELRTPLNAILGLSEVLQEGVFGPLTKKQQKSLRNIEESGHHLLNLINDILDLSKAGVGKLELDIAPVYVENLCQICLRLISQAAYKKHLNIISNIADTITTIQVDERRLKQILINLLSNAIKFTPEHSQIGLEVTEDETADVVHFTVWDQGIGISSEDMDFLFQPFIQLDSNLSRRYEGTGLGLSLVSQLTELHGGSVAVESETGIGSRFIITLPKQGVVAPVQVAQSSNRSPSVQLDTTLIGPDKEAPLVLLAEDNEANISSISELLITFDYYVIVARNGAEAVIRAKENHPDIILMDIQMPIMDGFEAASEIRSDPELASIPIIALTALVMPGDKERCLAAGMNDYLSKPVRLKVLAETIGRYLA